MDKEFAVRRLDVKAFAQAAGQLAGEDTVGAHERLMAETQGRGAASKVSWSAHGEWRNARHVRPEVWLFLQAQAHLSLTCQRCLAPVEVPVTVDRSFRFVADEETAAAEDDQSEEDVLALSAGFDLVELIEDELLMELPVAPRHQTCPEPLKLAVATPDFDQAAQQQDNPFALLQKLRTGKH